MLGHAVADALGVPVEFKSRAQLKANPVTDMRAYGTHYQPKGTWSDDTSMSVAAMEVLATGKVDYKKIMDNFAAWVNKAEFTATGEFFDIGGTCSDAIRRYKNGNPPLKCGNSSENSNGNGSLMRIHPFVLFAEYSDFDGDRDRLITEASSLTHAHPCTLLGCLIYAEILTALLRTPTKGAVRAAIKTASEKYKDHPQAGKYARILNADIAALPENEIQSSGYVLHTLEAALWCLLNTETYTDCVLLAVNLGDDTDTVGAVAGSLAGALYGIDAIPTDWLTSLKKLDYLENLCSAPNWSK